MVTLKVADLHVGFVSGGFETFADRMPDIRRLLLAMPVNATVALFHHVRIPGNLDVNEVVAVVLEVYALGRRIGGEQDADLRNIRRGLERGGDLGSFFGIKTAVKLGEPFTTATVVRENLKQPTVRGAILGKQNHACAIPLALRPQVLVNPRKNGGGL